MRSPMSRLLALLFAFSLVAASCGSDEDADTDTDPTTTTAPTGTDTTEDAGEDDTEDEGDDEDAAPADACAIDNLNLFAPGKLTIATGEPVFPPWMMEDDPTNGEGFESAVAYALATQMGFAEADVEWVRTSFDEAIAAGDKPYDFNMQQYSITAARDELVDFSIPYYQPDRVVVALADSPIASATSLADLADARWGATIGTIDLDYIETVLGVDDAAVFNELIDVVSALRADQIDATVISFPTAFFMTAVQLEEGTIVGVLPPSEELGDAGMGLLFAEGNPLVECVNDALTTLTDNGTLAALAVQWLQGDGAIPTLTE